MIYFSVKIGNPFFESKSGSISNWEESPYRKPLILRGARQTGKTGILKEFGTTSFKNFVYVNFEETPVLKTLYKEDFNLPRILKTLQIYSGLIIIPGETLIILDEIQSAENGITSLKYFCENA